MRFSSLLSAAVSFAAVVYAQQTNGQNSITFPLGGVLDASLPLTIKWTPSTKGTITIKLLRGPPTNILDIEVVAASVENTGTFTWTIPGTVQGSGSLPAGERYGLKIIDDLTNTFEYSPPFDISVVAADPVPVAGPTSVPPTSAISSSSAISTNLPSSTTSASTSASTPISSSSTTATELSSTAAVPTATSNSAVPPPTSAPTAAAASTSLVSSAPTTTFATTTRSSTTASTPTQSGKPDEEKSKPASGPNIVMIAGVMAGIVGLGLAALGVFMILKRRSRRRESAHIPMRERPHSDATYNRVKG